MSVADWRSVYNRGIDSEYYEDFTLLIFGTKAGTGRNVYLTNASVGHNMVASQISDITIDLFDDTRVYPSDAGATDKDAT